MYLGQIDRSLWSPLETFQQSLVVDIQVLLTLCHTKVPARSSQEKPAVDDSLVNQWCYYIWGDILSGFLNYSLFLFTHEEHSRELLLIIPGGLMSNKTISMSVFNNQHPSVGRQAIVRVV